MKTVTLPGGAEVPALGLGTWRMGEDRRRRAAEVAVIRRAVEIGMTLIDTAEMYGDGKAEEEIGEALAGWRGPVYIVSKVYPHNASRRGTIAACERSLRRLRAERIDLYLLHWRGSLPLADTLEAFAELKRNGKIGDFGVSNFDTADMREAWQLPHGPEIAANQILYNLSRRGPEGELIPWCREHRVPIMAYSPVEQGRLLTNPRLVQIARARQAAPAQVALAWLLAQPEVIVIPKTSDLKHLAEDYAASEIELSPQEMEELDRAFPPPRGAQPLQML